jgi:ketosteroid isomerase-like protein
VPDDSLTPDLAGLVRGFVASAASNDWEAILRHYATDAVWDTSRNGVGTFEGVATIRRFWEDWGRAYEELEFVVEELVDLGGGVVFVVVLQNARPAGTDGYIRQREGWIYAWANGLCVRVTVYPEAEIDVARAAAERLAQETSQPNVEVVRSAFRAFGARGVDAALAFFSPDVVWYTSDRWLDGSAYRGHEGMRTVMAAFTENFDDFRFEVHDIRGAQERVVALADMVGRIRNSGAEVSQRLGFVVSNFHGGTFGEVRAFTGWPEALKAVGLEA